MIKYNCEKNDNRFPIEYLRVLATLIYSEDEDIVYSVVELL